MSGLLSSKRVKHWEQGNKFVVPGKGIGIWIYLCCWDINKLMYLLNNKSSGESDFSWFQQAKYLATFPGNNFACLGVGNYSNM